MGAGSETMPVHMPEGISVVVPVYKGADVLPALIGRLEAVLQGLGRPFEVLLVNDGSPDGSWQAIREAAERHRWVRGINLMRNYGQHNALLCGVRLARYSVTVTLDDDLQHPPEEIPKLLVPLDRGHDVVYGKPAQRQHSFAHNLGSKMLYVALSTTLGARTARMVSAFRAFRTGLRDAFQNTRSPWVILDVYLTWATNDFVSIVVRHEPRAGGRAGYTLRRRMQMALDMITGFSTLPLRMASLIGFFFTLFGVGVLVYVLAIYLLFDTNVPGWAFLASTIAILSGAQLFALGIVGEYLSRMFLRMMDRPPYGIRETTDKVAAGSTGGSPASRRPE
jgi:undecaprenyl-phosphate 4-deoxy-4-formamido-L-arabinose transferase